MTQSGLVFIFIIKKPALLSPKTGMSRCFHKKFKFCAWNCRSVEESWDSVHDIDHKYQCTEFEFEFIGVLLHMQQYFSHICDGTDVQAD